MELFKNLNVRKKMIVSFALVIALMSAMAGFAIIQMNIVSGHFEYSIEHPSEAEIQLSYFISTVREQRRMVSDMVIYSSSDLERVSSIYNEAVNTFNEGLGYFDKFEQTYITDNKMARAEKDNLLKRIADLKAAYINYEDNVLETVYYEAREGNSDSAYEYMVLGRSIAEYINDRCDDLITIAEIAASNSIASAEAAARRTVMILIGIAFVAAILAVMIALYVSSLISKPLLVLYAFMKKAGTTGDIALSPEDAAVLAEYSKMKDEIGQSIDGSTSFIRHVTGIADELKSVAGGDLTVDVKLLSDSDTMGRSMKQVADSLSSMFTEIRSSTNQVSAGSKQVADGAQSLAQGSTEQAASIEELSSSIADIAMKTKENATIAERASSLSLMIKNSAEKGSGQMDEMIAAVKDINDASQSISKIIKTIDDIAFQTNILALNAAVEAARAGQHGKGFAVVAEEVRNLASKSAEAAKETGDMIRSSMDKAELGSRIAGDTAASLSEIVSGINESSRLITEIAKSSEEQSFGISQINIGIDQVAQVVQQNSATAEESAAASEEMSGQSGMLEQLIAQFKLK